MVLYGFIWFYNRPLKQDMSKPITCDVTGKKFRISSSSNRDRAVQWWVTSCWRVNLTVKHVGKSWWKLIWVLFATTHREREIILNLLLLSMERDISSTRQWGSCETTWKKTMIAQMYTDMCRLIVCSIFLKVPASLEMHRKRWSQCQSSYTW